MIAIPNMSKPTSCNKCPFTCEALQFFNGKDRPQSCPLIEISDNEYKAFQVYIKNICKRIEERLGE